MKKKINKKRAVIKPPSVLVPPISSEPGPSRVFATKWKGKQKLRPTYMCDPEYEDKSKHIRNRKQFLKSVGISACYASVARGLLRGYRKGLITEAQMVGEE